MFRSISIFQVVLIGTFGALAVVGVLIFAFAVGGGNANTVGSVQIWGTLDQGAFAALLRATAENDSRVAQVTYVQKDPDTYIDEVTQALASGTGPDLIVLRQDSAVHETPRILPIPYDTLSDTLFKNTFADATTPFLSEGGVLGLPFAIDPLVLYWNRDMLQAAGYAKAPAHWDELYAIAQKVTKRTDSGTITKSAIALGEYRNVDNAKDILSMLIMQAGGSITTRDTSGKLTPALTPRAGEAGQASASALRFYTEFADPSKEDYTWNRARPDARTVFASGDLALYIGYASEQPLISRMNPNLNYAIASIPQIRDTDRILDFGRSYAFAVPRTSKNPTGAVTVAYILASTDTSKILSEALGIPSARRDVLNQPATGYEDLFNRQAIVAQAWLDPDPKKTETIFQAMIENTTSGTLLLNEAITRASQEMAQILGL